MCRPRCGWKVATVKRQKSGAISMTPALWTSNFLPHQKQTTHPFFHPSTYPLLAFWTSVFPVWNRIFYFHKGSLEGTDSMYSPTHAYFHFFFIICNTEPKNAIKNGAHGIAFGIGWCLICRFHIQIMWADLLQFLKQ